MKELTDYIDLIATFPKDAGQDAEQLHEYLIHLTNIMARANFLMAENGRKFREAKKTAYQNLQLSMGAQGRQLAPSLAKDYIDSMCAVEGYDYDLAERVSRLCSHTMDAIRTVISSLKSEREFSKYAQ